VKKLLFSVALGLFVILNVPAADTLQVRLPLTVTTPWLGDDLSRAMLGLAPELIFDQVGFGIDGNVRFTRDSSQLWSMDFRGQLFASYHLSGVESRFDPFVLAGLGSAGWLDLSRGARSTNAVNLSGIALALVPSMGAGFAFDLGGLVVGARVLWFPASWDIPAAPINLYHKSPTEVSVFVAWALVDHAP